MSPPPRRLRARRALLVASFGALFASCPASRRAVQGPDADGEDEPALAVDDEVGLQFTLSEGRPEAAAVAPPPLVQAGLLYERDIEGLLARLPSLPAEAADVKPVALRAASQPPAKTGGNVLAAFPGPPAGSAPAVTSGPLTVVRHGPDGEVPLAADFSLTFSQPMVAVTSRDALAAANEPVKLTPQPPGQWTWVGTRTLQFRPSGRFPMATEYRVDVPAGLAAASGEKLSQGTSYKFATPPPKLLQASARDATTTRSPAIFLAFNQRIDPAAVLPKLRLVPEGGEAVPLRLVARDEAVRDRSVRAFVEHAEDGRWLVVRPTRALPGDSRITFHLDVGLPSAEGPRTTRTADRFTFRTHGALVLASAHCGWDRQCPPGVPFRFVFSSPLDARRFKQEWVRVEPALPDLHAGVYGNELHIQGATRASTSYRVTVDADLRDEFGQRLGAPIAHSFKVGPAPASLHAPGGSLVVLDPAAGGKFSIFTTGHKTLNVRVHAVTPADWDAYGLFQANAERKLNATPTPPGRPVFTDTIKIDADPDVLHETAIDLGPALQDGLGHAIVVVEPTVAPSEPWQRERVVAWVQSTKIGLDAFVDGDKLVAYTSDLATGAPLDGVQLSLVPSGVRVVSDRDGLATLKLPPRGNRALLAVRGADQALLPEHAEGYFGDSIDTQGWRPHTPADDLLWHVFDDRQIYRPGETARIKGWLRVRSRGPRKGLALPGERAREVRYTLRDSQGNWLLAGVRPVNALGGFDLALELPKTPNLGPAILDFEVITGSMKKRAFAHSLQIQEFRRPEYEVTTRANEGPHFVGGHAALTVAASYYSGGPLIGAEVRWAVAASPGHYIPPGRDEYTFGRWRPWWGHFWRVEPAPRYREPETFTGRTDAAGEHHLRADFLRVTPIEPTSLRAEATVVDVNRQAWTAATQVLVHPASVYVGLKSARLFVQKGEPLQVDAIAVDLDGKAVTGREIVLRATRLAWEQVAGEWREVEKDPQLCRHTSAEQAVGCSFDPGAGGTYRVRALVKDESGRENSSELTLWVAGGDSPPARDIHQQQVQIIPDKQEYRAGERAKLLVMAPFAPAEGVVTLRHEGLLSTRRISLQSDSTTLEIPIEDAHAPNVQVQVDLVGAVPRTREDGRPDPRLPKRPAFAAGHLDLAVPPRSRTLNLSVKPAATKVEPGGRTSLEVVVRDANERPVAGGEVAVVVVDEAVLALSNYTLADPLASFFPHVYASVQEHHNRASLVLAEPAQGQVSGGTVGGPMQPTTKFSGSRDFTAVLDTATAPPQTTPTGGAKGGPSAPPIAVRTNFDALALFAASLPTDAHGRARVDIRLPDNLTRYRVMAVAVAGADRFGVGESAITARLPLMVRPSPPRFLNFGDEFELPVVLHNQTDAPLTVDLAARVANLDLTAGAGRKVHVPANDRVEVRLPAAAVRPGTARYQLAAAAGKYSDAITGELPVWTPATTEAFATYGQLDAGAVAQPIAAPADALPQFGGLELTTSSTALAELTDAVLYLARYPFECSEQLASRVITIAALRDVLGAFQASGLPRPDELLAFVGADIERLARMQNPDGGWAFWRRGDPSWPYLSVHVAHALERARGKGFTVPPTTLDRAQDYLRDIETRIDVRYPREIARPIIAYALHVRARLGMRDPAAARKLLAEVPLDKHSLETLGWLLPVLGDSKESKEILRHLGNQVRETAGAAHFSTGYSDGGHLILHSQRRVDGVLLEALIGAEASAPGSGDLIAKLVRGLLSHRKAGRWNNTQENAFVLLALDRYFAAYEKATPDFVVRAWLGDRSAGEYRFKGRSAEQQRVAVPIGELIVPRDLVLAKDGPGRLYFRLGLRYASKDLSLGPVDHGFGVERKYEALDDPADVRRDGDGTWRIRAGARVKVTVTMVAQDRRYHVALVDSLPAGLEAVNPALATSATVEPAGPPLPTSTNAWWRWWGPWYQHENLRDERVEAFTSLLWDGVHEYSYIARATTPGVFVAPPAKAEEMYAPETFGRSGSDRVIVE